MMDSTEISTVDLLLQDADFPDYYVNKQHKEDYIAVDKPFTTYIPHFSGRHNRLIARVCWKKDDTTFVPISLVCDTGAPMGFYLSTRTIKMLKDIGRLKEDDIGNQYVYIQNVGRASVDPIPDNHEPANLIGLRVLTKVGFNIVDDSGAFKFNNAPHFW